MIEVCGLTIWNFVCLYVVGGGGGAEDYLFICLSYLSKTNAISALLKRPKKGFKLDINFASYEYSYLKLFYAILDKKLRI